MAGMMQSLARLITPRQKANPAGEGNYHPGPYNVSGGVLPSAWGQYLNFWQMDLDPVTAPGCSTVEACVWAYIRAIAQLPGYHKRALTNNGTETVTTSALSRLLRQPNGYQTPSDFLVHLIRSLLYTGNSYWIAQRNDRQEVEALHWTDPRTCSVRQIRVQGQVFSEIFYDIGGGNPLINVASIGRNSLIVPARDVLHIKLDTRRNPLIGETWLSALAPEMATRSAIAGAASTFSNNMSRPSGVLTTDLQIKQPDVESLRARWNEQAKGMNAGGVPILTHGLKFQPISISNEDAQVIEQLKLNDRTIAAVFGVPAIMLGITDTGTQKTAEALMSEWLASGLGFVITHIEQAFDKFIGLAAVPEGREWTEFDTSVLLRSMFRERIEGLARAVQGGIFSPNEARALEGYPAAKDGDEPRVQQQVVPLSFAMEPPAPPAALVPPPLPADAADGEDPPPDKLDDGEKMALERFHLQREIAHVRAA
jgi:HK97 family phage portal protein